MMTAPASVTPIRSHVRNATRSPSRIHPSNPVTYGPNDMRMSVLATDVCASEKMKHVDDTAMHTAAATIGRPPSRHCPTRPRPRTSQSTSARNSEAKKLRHRVVVQGEVSTRRTMSDPLLQHNAAQATSSAPRRVASVAGSRHVATESGADVMSEAQAETMLPGTPRSLLPRLDPLSGLGLAYGTPRGGPTHRREWRPRHEASPIRGSSCAPAPGRRPDADLRRIGDLAALVAGRGRRQGQDRSRLARRLCVPLAGPPGA